MQQQVKKMKAPTDKVSAAKGSTPKAKASKAGVGAAVGQWGRAVPTAQERDEMKRQSIIRAAAQCFNRSGFHGTSMDDIAARLGVTKPALYRYVKNKHEVLAACFSAVMEMSFAHLENGEKTGRTGLEKLRITLRGYLEDLLDKLGHPVVLLEEGALLPEQLRSLIRNRDQMERRYRALVEEGMRDGSIISCDPKLAVFALFGAINWVPKWYREDGEWSAAYVAESLVNLITRSIAADPGVPQAIPAGKPPASLPLPTT
ncbi:MAG: TetR/AcrR family transcriptional regulator [Ottowia sp.]|uniref:TetR family transcriptional regulator n=1 Tax=Ottowia sp. TaxID=1898956 RepID=UPI0039E570A1